MRIKFATMMAVIAFVFISGGLTVLGQPPQPNPPKSVRTEFVRIVGRNPTPHELAFWEYKQPKTNQTDFRNVAHQIMDWFIAPAQGGERLAAIDNAYRYYYERAAYPDEKSKVESLVRSKRMAAQDVGSVIAVDLTITNVTDVLGDPKSVNVTVSNLSTISTSKRTTVHLVVFKAPRCHPWTDDQLAVPMAPFSIPILAAQQSTTVKVTSTQVLQHANSQRGAYLLNVNGKGENYEPYISNNERCVPGVGVVADKVVGQKSVLLFPKNLRTPVGARPPLRKP